MMRIGLIGASRIAPNAILEPARRRKDVVVTAVAAGDPARATHFATMNGIPATSALYADLVTRDDVDVVYCALPPPAHLDICERALAAGKMLLVEKPFAADADAAGRIASAAKAAGRPVLEAFHYRFHSQFGRALSLVRLGALGRVRRAEGVFNAPIAKTPGEFRWRADQGGGAMLDLGCYPMHALRTLLNGEPAIGRVDAEIVEGVDASLRAELWFGDVPAVVSCSMTRRTARNHLSIEGDEGVLTLHNFVAPQHRGRLVLVTQTGVLEEAADGPTTYAAQMEHLVRVWRGETPPLTGGSDAVDNMVAIDACRSAAHRT